MLYIVIGVIVGIITFIWLLSDHADSDWFFVPFIAGGCALILSLLVAIIFIGEPEMEHFSETYRLEKMEENQYYHVNTEGNSVSVYVTDGNFKEKMTFPEEVVKFNSYANEASIQIEGEKYKEPSESEEFWFWVTSPDPKENEYEEVIISVPEGSEISDEETFEIDDFEQKPEVESAVEERKEEKTAAEAERKFCIECGSKIESAAKFCGECGKKL